MLGYAHTLVRTAPRFAGIVNFLVGNVLIVTTLQMGIELVRGRGLRDTIVTLGGEQITGGGAITGGRFARERSILSRRFQAASLRDALVGMRAKLEEARARLCVPRICVPTLRSVSETPRAERQGRIESQLVGLRAEARRAGGPRSSARTATWRRLARRRWNCARERRDARELEREHEREEPRRSTAKTSESGLKRSWHACARRSRAPKRRRRRVKRRGAEFRERAAALAAERDASQGAPCDARPGQRARRPGARRDARADRRRWWKKRARSHAHVEGLRRGVAALDAELDAARREREELAARQTQLESELRAAEQDEREATAGGERHRTRLAQVEAELGMLVSQFAQNPATDDECADVEGRYARARRRRGGAAAPARRARAPAMPTSTSTPRPSAARLRSASGSCATQIDDLTEARETLLDSIREIEA